MTLAAPEPLGPHHLLDGFDSGVPSLDEWLKRRARPNQASGASRTFVVAEDERAVAYYSLASGAVAIAAAPGRFRRNMPDPIPAVLLGRLAVDRAWQRRGLGRALFRDAASRILNAADSIGVRGILVHALSDQASAFYTALGFDPSPLDPMTLMVTLAEVRAAMHGRV